MVILFCNFYYKRRVLQNVSDKITNNEAGDPIIGASIIFPDSGKAVNSDIGNGFFISPGKRKMYNQNG